MLSGGGARGAAHIGVLKMLDQLHVPIDAIAGTSMGAVVGGLYASGMSGEQIEQAMASLDWQAAFRDRPPRTELDYRRKEEDRHFLVNLPLGCRVRSWSFPKGLVQGQMLTETLRQLTLPVAHDHRLRSAADAFSRRRDQSGNRRASGSSAMAI